MATKKKKKNPAAEAKYRSLSENAMAQHRQRVLDQKKKIDNDAPSMKSGLFVKNSSLEADKSRFKDIMYGNLELLTKINIIQRTQGTNTINAHTLESSSKIRENIANLEKIEAANHIFGVRLKNVKKEIDNRWPNDKMPTIAVKHIKKAVLVKQPSSENFFKPRVYFDLEVQNIRPLGRIQIVLYTEISPRTVLNFVRLCYENNTPTFTGSSFRKIFPGLYMEGGFDNTVNDKNFGKNDGFVMENFTMKHEFTGVLSIGKQLNKNKNNYTFAINFKPLPLLNGKRMVFGKVYKGLDIIETIQDYGTKDGKPKKTIVIRNCGLL